MAYHEENSLKYLTIAPDDRIWGVVTTTVGSQKIAPNACYPAMHHPETHEFKPQRGRILDEYQLVYITEGAGFFESKSVPRQRIEAGTVILLFPGEWHNYAPEESCGWQEYWVGFQGENINRLIDAGLFTRDNALIKIGTSNTIIALYKDAIRIAKQESIGCQQMISGIVMHILSAIYYKHRNGFARANRAEEIINEALHLMREQADHSLRTEDIAMVLGVGYSWFRQTFKRVTGISPTQYLNRLLMSRAKEVLVTEEYTITEIADLLGFDNAGHFSTAFRKTEGVTPRQFREENRLKRTL